MKPSSNKFFKFPEIFCFIIIFGPFLLYRILRGLIDTYPSAENFLEIASVFAILLFPLSVIIIAVIIIIAFHGNKYKILKYPFAFSSFDNLSKNINNDLHGMGYFFMNSRFLSNASAITTYAKLASTHVYDFVFVLKADSIAKDFYSEFSKAIDKIPKECNPRFDKVYQHRYSIIFCLDKESELSDKLINRKYYFGNISNMPRSNIFHTYTPDDSEFVDNNSLYPYQMFQPIVVNLTEKNVSIPYRITQKGKEITCSIRDELLEVLKIDTSIHRHTIANGEYHSDEK